MEFAWPGKITKQGFRGKEHFAACVALLTLCSTCGKESFLIKVFQVQVTGLPCLRPIEALNLELKVQAIRVHGATLKTVVLQTRRKLRLALNRGDLTI
jgi:hypothetical protein